MEKITVTPDDNACVCDTFPKICFLNLCAMFLIEMLSLHLAQHIWPAMLVFLDFPDPAISVLL